MLLEVKTFKGQRLHYQPIGEKGVRTGNVPGRGWYLTKGEPLDVIEYDEATRTLVVECPALKGAKAREGVDSRGGDVDRPRRVWPHEDLGTSVSVRAAMLWNACGW